MREQTIPAGASLAAEQAESILRHVADAITVQAPDGRLLYANDAAVRSLGFESQDELLNAPLQRLMSHYELLASDGSALPLERLPGRLALGGVESEQLVRYRIRGTGEERWALVRGTPVYDDSGAVAFAVNIFRDVTEAHRGEERLLLLTEVSAVLAASSDVDRTLGHVVGLVVPRLADGCAVEVLEDGDRLRRVADAGTLDAGRPLSVPLAARGRALGTITFVRGPARPGFAAADSALAEELAGRVAVALDNARLLHEAEERGHAARALAYVADGVFLLDDDCVIRYWNPAAEAVTGLRAEDVVGRTVEEAVPGWTRIAERVAAAPAGRPATVPLDVPGGEVWLSIGRVGFEGGVVFAFRDLTEERAVEQLKNDFVSTVSHELRTPLAAIYGAARTLLRRDIDLDAAQRGTLLGVIGNESDRLARTVNDILWASRLDSGTLRISLERCDASALVREVVDAARAHLPERMTLAVWDTEPAPWIRADPDKVRQVLVNLVDNAVKYSPDGGLVEVRLARREGTVRFSIRDEGLGIAAAEQRRIFEKFYRVDPNLSRGIGGTGLGLYICRELVRRMDGHIWVESSEGEGSTFSFELPVATEDATGAASAAPADTG